MEAVEWSGRVWRRLDVVALLKQSRFEASKP
jgi:hypothetical protein